MGGRFPKNGLLARLTAHAVSPRQGLDQGKKVKQGGGWGSQKTLQDGTVMGDGSGKNLSFFLFQGLLELSPNHLFEHLESKYLFS